MATIDNILTLIEKGYSKDEIDALLARDEVAEPEPEESPEESQEDANESQEDASAGEKDGDPSPLELLTQQVLDLTKQVQTMTAAVQLRNVKGAEAPDGDNKEMTAQDFLAQLINPNYKEDTK